MYSWWAVRITYQDRITWEIHRRPFMYPRARIEKEIMSGNSDIVDVRARMFVSGNQAMKYADKKGRI